MAEKQVAVRLTARIEAYRKAMREAKKSTDDFASGSQRNIQQLSKKMSSVGRDMSTYVTAPLAGVAVAAVKMSADFDSSMSKITALVGLGADEVDAMRESVLDMAGNTAKAPQELADALFVVTSAGLRGTDAMAALEMAAKASAAGLGQTNDIARAVAGAMNAYGPDVLDAAEATDILTATARAGNFETSQLAGALGRVLPFANQAKASFEDVGGAIALLTRTNGNAAESVTQVQALMRSFVVPTAEAVKILDSLDMSASDLRDSMGESGLVATIQMLDDKLGGNREQLGRLLGSSEAASAAFQILNADAQTVADTFGVTADAAGMTQDAFDTMSETTGFKLQQAWTDLQTSMIEVGDILAPIVTDLAGGVSALVGAFSHLDPALQKVVVGLGGLAAAAGPALMIGGSLLRNYQQISTTWSSMGRTSRMAAGAIGGIGLALAGASIIYQNYARQKQEAKQRTDEFVAALEAEAAGQKDAVDAMLARGLAELASEFEALGISAVDAARYIRGDNVPAIEALINATDKYGPSAEGFKALQEDIGVELGGTAADLEKVTRFVGDNKTAYEAAQVVYDTTTSTLEEMSESTDTSAYAAKAAAYEQELLARATSVTGEAAEDTAMSEEDLAAAEALLEEQTKRTAEAQEINARNIERAREAHEKYVESILDSLSGLFDHEQAVLQMENAYADLQEAMWENAKVQGDAEKSDADKAESARNLRLEELALAEQAYGTAEAYAEQSGAVEGSKEWVDRMVESLASQADQYPELRDEIALYISMLESIPTMIHTGVLVTYSTSGSAPVTINTRSDGGTISTSGRRAAGGPTLAGRMYEVNEQGSELLHEGGRTYLMAGGDGYVEPLAAVSPAMSSDGGGGTLLIQELNVYSYATNGDEFAREVRRAIEREQRWNGNVAQWGRS